MSEHNRFSSYRESLLEHLFAGELMKYFWLNGARRIEVLKPQVDDGGYDLVLESRSVIRHVQLKASFHDAATPQVQIHLGLGDKPSGCVVWIMFNRDTLQLGPFLWFGGEPGQRLPAINAFKTATHNKRNSLGVKTQRANIRLIPKAEFEPIASIGELAIRLFGPPAMESALE